MRSVKIREPNKNNHTNLRYVKEERESLRVTILFKNLKLRVSMRFHIAKNFLAYQSQKSF